MRRLALSASVVLSVFAAGCSSSNTPGNHLGSQSAPIIGGTTDTCHDAIMALITETNSYQTECTGTVFKVDADGTAYMLTAAHCTLGDASMGIADPTTANTTVRRGPNYSSPTQTFTIKAFTHHPKYNANNVAAGYDFGIVTFVGAQTTPTMPLTGTSDGLANGATVQIYGYGETMANMNAQQVRRYTVAKQLTNVTTLELHHNDSDGHGTCEGDSGGPSVVVINGVETVVGVTSYGSSDACNGDSAAGRVSDAEIQSWIQGVVGGSEISTGAGGGTASCPTSTGGTGGSGAGATTGAGGTTTTTGAGGTGAGGTGGGDGAICNSGISFDPSNGGAECATCVGGDATCCAAFTACAGDQACLTCLQNPMQSCLSNASFATIYTCESQTCATACGANSGTGGSGGTSGNADICTSGFALPAADASCATCLGNDATCCSAFTACGSDTTCTSCLQNPQQSCLSDASFATIYNCESQTCATECSASGSAGAGGTSGTTTGAGGTSSTTTGAGGSQTTATGTGGAQNTATGTGGASNPATGTGGTGTGVFGAGGTTSTGTGGHTATGTGGATGTATGTGGSQAAATGLGGTGVSTTPITGGAAGTGTPQDDSSTDATSGSSGGCQVGDGESPKSALFFFALSALPFLRRKNKSAQK